MVVVEEKPEALALDDQRIERRQDVGQLPYRRRTGSARLGPDPVHRPARALAGHRHQRRAAPAASINSPIAAFRGASMWQTESRLTIPARGARDRADSRGPARSVAGRGAAPSRNADRQLVALHHAQAFADREHAVEEACCSTCFDGLRLAQA